jgi:hypothetical protein
VLGNHDLRANHGIIVDELERAGVQVMANECASLGGVFADVTICGLDDPTHGDPRPDLAMDRAHGTRIVLVHSPTRSRPLAHVRSISHSADTPTVDRSGCHGAGRSSFPAVR